MEPRDDRLRAHSLSVLIQRRPRSGNHLENLRGDVLPAAFFLGAITMIAPPPGWKPLQFLSHTDDSAYVGLVRRAVETATAVLCPKCRGYGHWILKPNDKPGAHAFRDTDACLADRMCRGPHHFMSHCGQCNGWGNVTRGSKNETCMHEYEFDMNLGRCYNQYKCKHCGMIKKVDSSD